MDGHGDVSNPFKRPESAASSTRRTSGIPALSDRRTSGIPAPRRQSGLPVRPGSPTRSTSSSSFHSDTPQLPVATMGSMGAPTSLAFTRRQSGAQNGLGIVGVKSAIPVPGTAGRKSMGSGIPVPR